MRDVLAQMGAINALLELQVPDGSDAARWAPAPRAGATWVDLGSGDGASLRMLALRHPDVHFVGVDLCTSVTVDRGVDRRAIPNVVRVELPVGSAAELHRATVAALSSKRAHAVSLLFPIHAKQAGDSGAVELAVCHQLRTALALLAPGGEGILVTEDAIALRESLRVLRADSRCTDACVLPGPLSAEALRGIGIEPYAPTLAEVVPLEAAEADHPVGPLQWGFVASFVRGPVMA